MKKSARITLYVFSILMVVGMLFLIGFSRERQQTIQTGAQQENVSEPVSTEENTENTKEESEEPATEERQADSETESEETQEEDSEDKTTIIFAGDVLLAHGSFEANYKAEGITGVVEEELLKQLQDADIFMINNEFAFSTQGIPEEDKQYTFRADPKYVSALQEMGVDIVTLANNHTLDYGKVALSDTFTTFDNADILYSGAGESVKRAEELQIISCNGKKFGFLSATRVVPNADWKVEYSAPGLFSAYDDTRLVELVEAAQKKCDYLTVYVHWGIERDAYPQDYQTEIAKDCIEAGADLVVGAHPHCLQGIEYIDGKPVFYSLGNFIFGYGIEQTAALKVTISEDDEVTYQLIPAYAQNGKTMLMDESVAGNTFDYVEQISVNAKIDENGFVTK